MPHTSLTLVEFTTKTATNKVYIERRMKISFITYRRVTSNKCYVTCILKLSFEAINVENENISETVWRNHAWSVVFWNATNKIAERRRWKFFGCESLKKQRKSHRLSVCSKTARLLCTKMNFNWLCEWIEYLYKLHIAALAATNEKLHSINNFLRGTLKT